MGTILMYVCGGLDMSFAETVSGTFLVKGSVQKVMNWIERNYPGCKVVNVPW